MNGPRPGGSGLGRDGDEARTVRPASSGTGPSLFQNDEGRLSGAKSVLWLACGLCVAWLVRDLLTGRDLSETHAALLAALLVIGLINRLSARGHLKIRLGRDGAEFSSGGDG